MKINIYIYIYIYVYIIKENNTDWEEHLETMEERP